MAGATREQALSLLSAAKNHADLAVKLSSLKQAKEILLSLEPSVAAELFPYIVQLQASPESLVRKFLVELIEELTPKVMEQSSVLLPVLLAFLKDDASMVVRQSIVSGINIFCSCLEAMTIQFHQSGRVERWLEELWMWMTKLKDAIFGVSLEPVSVGTKLLAIKFLEMYVLLFTSDSNDSEISFGEGKRRTFNISRVVNGHPILDPSLLTGEVNKTLGHLLDLVQSANTLSGPQIIAVINCLAAIARKRPLHFGNILSVLLGFDPNFETVKAGHSASIQYSLRTALLGFLRCTHPAIIESRDKLLKALRAMNAGDTADQVIRKVDKMLRNNDRVLRDSRFSKEDQPSSQLSVSDDMTRKRSMLQGTEELFNVDELPAKRICYNFVGSQPLPVQVENGPAPYTTANGLFTQVPSSDNTPSPTEQMISVIGALLALGEKGAESLEILVSEIHPDQMADIVMANMKNLPKNPPAIASRLGIVPVTSQMRSSSTAPVVEPAAPTFSQQPPDSLSHATLPLTSTIATNAASSDLTPTSNLPADYKRDPRRDPRRLDPRRTPAPTEVQSLSVKENIGDLQPMKECSTALSTPLSLSLVEKVENTPSTLMCKSEEEPLNNLADTSTDVLSAPDEGIEIDQGLDIDIALESPLSPFHNSEPDLEASRTDIALTEKFGTYVLDYDEHSPAVSNSSASEETTHDLPLVPLYVDLTEAQKISVSKLAVERIFESCKRQRATGFCQTRMALLARLVAQTDADDEIVAMLQKHTILDYQQQKGHELALSVLYYLHTTLVSTSEEHSTFVSRIYEKFLLAVAKSLWDKLPSSDKSFSRFLGDVPLLPDSALKLLEELSFSDDQNEKDARDADRITQGLGAVWSLILWRPVDRKACLNIALRCAVHTQEDVRAKAIRLVANKLYSLSYVSENIEQFATSMLLSVTGQQVSDAESPQAEPPIERMEGNVGGQESSVSGSQNSDPGGSESGTVKSVQQVSRSATTLSMSQAHRNMSLFFALCIKKPSLLQLVFDIYGRAPKTIKQAVHRHIPILVKNLGSSYSELLLIISDPPQGSENLLMLVLQILTEETAPSAELIATVKYLYETKLKDAAILIPMLSLLSKDEVLPIFPRLVDLPLEKFQTALARILQGSAHTGPALTPAEVLVAVHDINPEKDNIALKKITDACSACFEQRTVFTQQVLAKALNQLVEKNPIPLLFMRTVIQAVDAFPSLVDVVMDILSKLVSRQIWKMPKLWVGFLKCAAQTQPHSFHVLLQLPPQQLESALSKHANLRGSLVAHASQPSIRSSLSRATLMVLGIANESPTPRPFLPSPFHASDTSSSVHGATLT